MKQTVQLETIQHNMRPGKIIKDGFLGNDTRKLAEILESDDNRVKHMGLSHEAIGARMLEFREKGAKGLGNYVKVAPHFEVMVDSVRGKLPCPFGHPGLSQKAFAIVRNLKKGKEITYTDLGTHMITAHGFYQGKGSIYRLDPEDIVDVLEIARGEQKENQILPVE